MIKRFAIILMCSLLLSGAVVETAQAHQYNIGCSGTLQEICEPNISSWSFTHSHDQGNNVYAKCWVYGYVYPKCKYCSTCGKKYAQYNYLVERHENCYGVTYTDPKEV